MTPLEIFSFAALGTATGQLITWLFGRPKRDVELEQRMVRSAFEAGILAAADMATIEGHEELAGNMRKAVAKVRSSHDS
jgi:hypothetical protein